MWVLTQHGFYSIVEHRDDPDLLLARGRVKDDIQRLADYANAEVVATPTADYPWRVIVPRSVVAAFFTEAIEQIHYDNYKKHVDLDRAVIYAEVWRQLHRLEWLDEGVPHGNV